MAIVFLAYSFTGVNPGGLSAQSLLMFVPLVAMIIAGFDTELYAPRKLLWFPKFLVKSCAAVGFTGFILFSAASAGLLGCGDRITAYIGFALCTMCLLACAVWTGVHYKRSKWTKEPGAFEKKHLWISANPTD